MFELRTKWNRGSFVLFWKIKIALGIYVVFVPKIIHYFTLIKKQICHSSDGVSAVSRDCSAFDLLMFFILDNKSVTYLMAVFMYYGTDLSVSKTNIFTIVMAENWFVFPSAYLFLVLLKQKRASSYLKLFCDMIKLHTKWLSADDNR